MAPNPIMLPRKRQAESSPVPGAEPIGLAWPLIATGFITIFVISKPWARTWMLSGAGVETLSILFAAGRGSHIFPSVPLWTLLASFNFIYAFCATSWLLHGLFTAACWPFLILTSLWQFRHVADWARKRLRDTLKGLQFTRDRIALFNLPALEIDTEVSGLMVIRGVTISLSTLTIVVHGVEVGIKLADEIELAMHADQVRIPLFRSIEIGDVYANVKGGKDEMTFADVEPEEDDDDDFINNTALLRAATAGSEGISKRPRLRESGAHSFMQDSSAKDGYNNIKTMSPDSQEAEKHYDEMITEIRTSSAVYQSRQRVRKSARGENGFDINDEKDMRAAIAAELHDVPSVPHPPGKSVKVTTLQKISPPYIRRFMHRLPFLLRCLLGPLSYFHPISINSINAAGSGKWVKALLQAEVFKQYSRNSLELRRLERRIFAWLNDANFCLQLCDIDGLGQVPINSFFDIVAYLHFADIMAYRTLPNSGVLTQVIRLGGADATFTIPSFLLPHHEHLLPPRPSKEDFDEMHQKIDNADGVPKTVQAEQEAERVKKDETTVTMSVHASLPAAFDQSMLNFLAALVKATKVIEFDKEIEVIEEDHADTTDQAKDSLSLERAETTDSTFSASTEGGNSVNGVGNRKTKFKHFAANLKQNLKEASVNTQSALSKDSIREFVRDVHQSTKDGMKKAVVGSIVNDRWIAKMVGKVASNLETAQGDIGYSGAIPIDLEVYRPGPGDDGNLPKLLP